jgi:hypothetical protein
LIIILSGCEGRAGMAAITLGKSERKMPSEEMILLKSVLDNKLDMNIFNHKMTIKEVHTHSLHLQYLVDNFHFNFLI